MWTRGAVTLGLLLVLAGFALGIAPRAADVAGQEVRCPSVLGVGSAGDAASGRTTGSPGADTDAVCDHGLAGARVLVWGTIVLGALVGLAGWTGLREDAAPSDGRTVSGRQNRPNVRRRPVTR